MMLDPSRTRGSTVCSHSGWRGENVDRLRGMVRIGLTGGIASGKTLASNELAELGAVVIDADVLARQVVEPGSEGLAEIVARYGEQLLLTDGSLDRAQLGELIFGDADARADLNAIIHPRVRTEAQRLEEAAPPDSVVVHVIPLLVETGQQGDFDAVLVVDIREDEQLRRLVQRNGLTSDEARARMAAQASRAERLTAATYLIDNSGAAEETRESVRDLWHGPLTQLRQDRRN